MPSAGKFFHQFADQFDTIYDQKRSRFMQMVDRRFRHDMFERFAMTFEFMGDISGKTILDIGCGSGLYVAEALKRGALRVTAIDPAQRMLELTAKRIESLDAIERLQLIEGYFPTPALRDKFHFGIVMGVMDYVSDPVPFLSALRQVTTEGAALSFPSIHWFRTPFRRFRYRLRKCPVYFYTEKTIERLAKEAGISGITVHKVPGAGMDFVVLISP